jgi:hypothetical protein
MNICTVHRPIFESRLHSLYDVGPSGPSSVGSFLVTKTESRKHAVHPSRPLSLGLPTRDADRCPGASFAQP